MQAGSRIQLKLQDLNNLVDRGIFSYFHNVIIIWGELSKGKTSLMMRMLYRILGDWKKVLSFILEPKTCLKCSHSWDANQLYVYEVPCEKCNKETKTQSLDEACNAVKARKLVIPFPYDLKTGFVKKFPEGTIFSVNSSPARGKITQIYPYMNFSFQEFRNTIENAVETRIRVPIVGWDDIAVYFHRSNIQYMHPDVKNFFSRYNFVKTYLGNVVITVPVPEFVPEQLALFCTADVLLTERGAGDFDTKRDVRSFYGKRRSWQKSYDGRDVTWEKVDDEWFNAYEEIRHAHAVEAYEKPEEIFVTTMPKTKEFTAEESLFQ